MAPRIARNNGDTWDLQVPDPTGAPGTVLVTDWNGQPIPPGALRVVDDESLAVLLAVDAELIELDPTAGRHYTAPPTERKVRPTP